MTVLYGPTPKTIDAVESTLRSEGLQVGALSANHLGLTVSGTAAQIGRAFSLGFNQYRIGSRIAYTNTAAAQLPGSIAGAVEGVIGLDNLYPEQHLSQTVMPKSHVPVARSLGGLSGVSQLPRGTTTGPRHIPGLARREGVGPAESLSQAIVPGHDSLSRGILAGVESPLGVEQSTQTVTPRANTRASSPEVVTGGPQPCSAAVTAAPDWYALTADQIASAYNFSSLYGAGDEGAGTTVALFELAPDNPSDIAAYQACYGTNSSVTYTEVDGGSGPSGSGNGIEPTLDIEEIIGLAPEASVDVYQGPNNGPGVYDTYSAIVSSDTAKVISTSWSTCEPNQTSAIVSSENTLFEEAAAQGQSIFASAGDQGSTDCGTPTLAVGDPASQPYVTAVGGTYISSVGPPPTQTVWNESSKEEGAGGGGISEYWPMPSYQLDASASLNVVNPDSSGLPCDAQAGSYCREIPDVSADADPYSGYLIYYTGVGDGGYTGSLSVSMA